MTTTLDCRVGIQESAWIRRQSTAKPLRSETDNESNNAAATLPNHDVYIKESLKIQTALNEKRRCKFEAKRCTLNSQA